MLDRAHSFETREHPALHTTRLPTCHRDKEIRKEAGRDGLHP